MGRGEPAGWELVTMWADVNAQTRLHQPRELADPLRSVSPEPSRFLGPREDQLQRSAQGCSFLCKERPMEGNESSKPWGAGHREKALRFTGVGDSQPRSMQFTERPA